MYNNKKDLMKKILLLFFFVHSAACPKILITLEGTTGAGKSTLLKLIQEDLSDLVQVVYEPVDKVQDVGGKGNLLELYYQDNKRWTYTFQTYAFVLQDQVAFQVAQETDKNILIGDRSIFSTYYVFGKMLHQGKIFSPLEWHLYSEWFDYAQARTSMKPSAFIYLRTTPDVCYMRIKKRNRSEEQEALLDYYMQEYYFHEKWLIDKEDIDDQWLLDRPLLILDGNLDFLHNVDARAHIMRQVRTFIEQCMEDLL